MRKRVTIPINVDLLKLARGYGAAHEKSLGEVIEEALSAHLPTYIHFDRKDLKEMKVEFISGPTISQMRPDK